MKLDGRTALVTGAAKRVGRTIALELAGRGMNLVVHYHTSRDAALDTVADIRRRGVGAVAVRGDVRSPKTARTAVQAALKAFGRLDVLVNNAATYPRTPFAGLTAKDWDDVLASNLRGPFLFAHAAAKVMLRQDAGKIVNLADWAGVRPYRNYLPYCVSKAGVIALTKGLAKELAPTITVNAVAPGPVLLPETDSPAARRAVIKTTPLHRIGAPSDIARAVIFLLESDFITGVLLPVDGGRLIA